MNYLHKLRSYAPILLFVIMILCIVNKVQLVEGDDTVFKEASETYGSIGKATASLYFTWAGRIPVLYTTMVVLNMGVSIWRIISTIIYAVVLLAMVYASGYVKKDEWMKTAIGAITATLLVFMHPDIILNSVLWITGCINYLWGAGAMMVVLIPFFFLLMHRPVPKWLYIVSALCTFYGCYIEQCAAFALAYSIFALCILAYRQKKKAMHFVLENKWILMVTICIIVNVVIFFTAPGNYVRNQSEMIQWFPSFDMYDMWDRILFGITNMMNAIRVYGVWFMVILSVLLVKTCLHRKDYFMGVLSMGICAYFIGMSLYPSGAEEILWIYDFTIRTDTYFTPSFYQALAIAIVVMGLIALILWKHFDCERNSKYSSVIFLGALCTGVVIGFSPTMFASNARVYFVPFFILVFVVSDLLSCMIDRGDLRLLYVTPWYLIILEWIALWWAYLEWLRITTI